MQSALSVEKTARRCARWSGSLGVELSGRPRRGLCRDHCHRRLRGTNRDRSRSNVRGMRISRVVEVGNVGKVSARCRGANADHSRAEIHRNHRRIGNPGTPKGNRVAGNREDLAAVVVVFQGAGAHSAKRHTV